MRYYLLGRQQDIYIYNWELNWILKQHEAFGQIIDIYLGKVLKISMSESNLAIVNLWPLTSTLTLFPFNLWQIYWILVQHFVAVSWVGSPESHQLAHRRAKYLLPSRDIQIYFCIPGKRGLMKHPRKHYSISCHIEVYVLQNNILVQLVGSPS